MRRDLLCALPLLAGCYTYTPVEPLTVRPGTEVRARLSAPSAREIAPLLGATDARVLLGTIVDSRADTLLLEVPTSARVAAAGTMTTLRQRVALARADLLELEERTFNSRRTAIVVGTAAAIVGSYLVKTLVLDPGKERMPTDPGGAELTPR